VTVTDLPIDLGDGIRLAVTTAADAEDTFAVVDAERDRLREWLPWVDGTSNVEIERAYLAGLALDHSQGTGLHATIRGDGHVLGMVGLRIKPVNRSAEIGYWLAEAAVGRGVMTRAVATMIDLAFTQHALHRVELMAATGNHRSRAVADRLGLTLEGVRREAEELASGFVDLAVYAVLVSEWPGAAQVLAGVGPTA
jgi:ribosomal-protein-serine acetyltransferase